jgi:hypothetical protein
MLGTKKAMFYASRTPSSGFEQTSYAKKEPANIIVRGGAKYISSRHKRFLTALFFADLSNMPDRQKRRLQTLMQR